MRPALAALLVLISLLALPCSALAEEIDLNLDLGLASPAGNRVDIGPALGLSAAYRLNPFGVCLGLDQSLHALAADASKTVAATTGTLGLELAIDDLPVVPVLGIGGALQFAFRRDSGASAWVPAGYLSAAVLRQAGSLMLGARIRYLTAGFSADGFPAFANFMVEVGWRL